jgi:hypothetical protein
LPQASVTALSAMDGLAFSKPASIVSIRTPSPPPKRFQ